MVGWRARTRFVEQPNGDARPFMFVEVRAPLGRVKWRSWWRK